MPYDSQHQLEPGELLNAQGTLDDAGHAFGLVRRYDRDKIAAGKMRIKEWDYYCISSPDAVLALTIADNGYMGLDSVTLLSVPMRWQQTRSFIRLFPMGKTALPPTSESGDVRVERKKYALDFKNDGTKRELTVRVDDFLGGKPLTAHIVLTDPPRDSMVIATPFAGKPKAFYYNQKINCLLAEGTATFDGQTYAFTKDNSMAVLDWGRGVWTYDNTWLWSSLSGRIDGEPFGFNLGYGFGDTSKSTENMLFYKGVAHKLEHVTFDIPQKPEGGDDFMKPWRFTDNNGRLDLTFTPFLDRASLTSVAVVKSDQHQVFGHFDGVAHLDDGTQLTLKHMLGFAEKVRNKW